MKLADFVIACWMLGSGLALGQNPVPLVNQPLIPDVAAPGSPQITLSVNGTGFVSGATVNWNGTALATTFVSQAQLTATVPAYDIANAGTTTITVTNPGPGGGTSNAQSVSVTQPVTSVAFARAVTYASGGLYPATVVLADVNGDGKLDLLVLNGCADSNCTNGSVGVLLGNGDGTFRPAIAYESGGFVSKGPCSGGCSITVADVNTDGKPDLLVVTNSGGGAGSVGVLLGNGDGSFQPVINYGSGGYGTSSVAAADVNGDGKLDLLVTSECADVNCGGFQGDSGTVGVLLGNGDGTFQPAVTYAAGSFASQVVIADLNGDGKLDLIVASPCPNIMGDCGGAGNAGGNVGVLLGNGDGTFQPVVQYPSGGALSFSLAVADVNGDAKPDVIVVSACQDGLNCKQVDAPVGVLLGNGDGTLQTVATYDSGGVVGSTLAVADLQGNGTLDAVVAFNCTPGGICGSGTLGGLSVLPGEGDGTFQNGAVVGSIANTTFQTVAVADLNRDGKPDIVVSIPSAGVVGVFLNLLATITAVGSSINPSVTGQSVTLTATVTHQGQGTLTGSVTFLDGTTKLGSASLGTNGVAALSLSTLALGAHSVTAAYSGDTNFAPSTSPASNQLVQDFSLVANDPTTQTVAPGQVANYSATLTPLDGFNRSISLSCSGAPAKSSCSVTPSSVTLDGSTAVPINIAVATQGTAAAMVRPAIAPGNGAGVAWLSFGMVFLFLRYKRLQWRRGAVIGCILSAFIFMPACGGGGNGRGNGGSGTHNGTYPLTVTGTYVSGSTQLSHTVQFTLIVQ
jgi:hypothetical protein